MVGRLKCHCRMFQIWNNHKIPIKEFSILMRIQPKYNRQIPAADVIPCDISHQLKTNRFGIPFDSNGLIYYLLRRRQAVIINAWRYLSVFFVDKSSFILRRLIFGINYCWSIDVWTRNIINNNVCECMKMRWMKKVS